MERQVSPTDASLISVPERDLFRLLQTAMQGNRLEFERFARILRRNSKGGAAELARVASEVIRASDSSSGPFRSETQATVPVDTESHSRLLRSEYPPVLLDNEPIWKEKLGEELRQILSERRKLEELHAAGLTAARSCLFVGPPGSGKTLAARWLAREMGLPIFTLDLSSVVSSLLGRTGSNIRNVLDFAKGLPCILLLDELDAIAKRRDDDVEIGELKRLVTVLLQEIDLWPERSILVGATNHPELLDRALWRRFDITVQFESPTVSQARQAIVQSLEGARLDECLVNVGAEVMAFGSFSDIKRDIFRARRAVIISHTSVDAAFREVLVKKISHLERADRHVLARRLLALGQSQREIQELTGVSRDMLRKLVTRDPKSA